MTPTPALDETWLEVLAPELRQPYMQELKKFLQQEKQAKEVIYPASDKIFNAFNLTPFDEVKVVILGQDPYHGVGQAHGLSFSVPDGITPPPSLKNIFKELHSDIGIQITNNGNLTAWAKQGILLLNSALSVRHKQPASHKERGWEKFTDAVIDKLNLYHAQLVFMLWGSYAQNKGKLIDRDKHLVIESPHPSPFAAHRGFFGSKPFSKTNAYLSEHAKQPINWKV